MSKILRSTGKKLVLEIERVEMIRKKCRLLTGFCDNCRDTADFVSAREITSLFGVEPGAFLNLTREHTIHFEPNSDGDVFLCISSLMAFINSKNSNLRLSGEITK